MLRILSDLHFRDASSRLTALDQLVPVLSGVSSLWLNGDTCDNQTGMSSAQLAEIKTFFQGQVPAVRFITGNHDPDISDTHHGSAADGRLFATHGDVFLDEIVPWSRVRQTLHTRVQQAQWDHPHHDSESLDGRLALNRIACVGFARECDPERTDFGHRFSRLVTEFFPPDNLGRCSKLGARSPTGSRPENPIGFPPPKSWSPATCTFPKFGHVVRSPSSTPGHSAVRWAHFAWI